MLNLLERITNFQKRYNDQKVGNKILDEFTKVHRELANIYPAGADKWYRTQYPELAQKIDQATIEVDRMAKQAEEGSASFDEFKTALEAYKFEYQTMIVAYNNRYKLG